MKKLGKVLRTAEIAGTNKQGALQSFLRAYRETPHSTTKVAPAVLLLEFSRSSGLPEIEQSMTSLGRLEKLHRTAQKTTRRPNTK